MTLRMTELEVRLPDRKRTSSSFSKKKPVAEVSCIMENGRVREIVVPVRVGRILDKEGIELPQDEEDAFDAIHALEGRMCFTLLTEMLSRRDHSTDEVRQKLFDYGFRNQEIEASISRALAHGFLNDDRFTTYFIEERKRRGWGRRKIEMELRRRGIDLESCAGYPDAFFNEEDDRTRAFAVLRRKPIPSTRAYEKLVRHLMTKGFPYSIASDVVKDHLSGNLSDEEVM